jgi:hypothetical protein
VSYTYSSPSFIPYKFIYPINTQVAKPAQGKVKEFQPLHNDTWIKLTHHFVSCNDLSERDCHASLAMTSKSKEWSHGSNNLD